MESRKFKIKSFHIFGKFTWKAHQNLSTDNHAEKNTKKTGNFQKIQSVRKRKIEKEWNEKLNKFGNKGYKKLKYKSITLK